MNKIALILGLLSIFVGEMAESAPEACEQKASGIQGLLLEARPPKQCLNEADCPLFHVCVNGICYQEDSCEKPGAGCTSSSQCCSGTCDYGNGDGVCR